MYIHTIKPADGSKKEARRLGRGIGSGLGKTAGKGHKGKTLVAEAVYVQASRVDKSLCIVEFQREASTMLSMRKFTLKLL